MARHTQWHHHAWTKQANHLTHLSSSGINYPTYGAFSNQILNPCCAKGRLTKNCSLSSSHESRMSCTFFLCLKGTPQETSHSQRIFDVASKPKRQSRDHQVHVSEQNFVRWKLCIIDNSSESFSCKTAWETPFFCNFCFYGQNDSTSQPNFRKDIETPM